MRLYTHSYRETTHTHTYTNSYIITTVTDVPPITQQCPYKRIMNEKLHWIYYTLQLSIFDTMAKYILNATIIDSRAALCPLLSMLLCPSIHLNAHVHNEEVHK